MLRIEIDHQECVSQVATVLWLLKIEIIALQPVKVWVKVSRESNHQSTHMNYPVSTTVAEAINAIYRA